MQHRFNSRSVIQTQQLARTFRELPQYVDEFRLVRILDPDFERGDPMEIGSGWLLGLLVAIYFAPSMIAVSLSHQQLASILLLNIIGLLVIPWIVALVRACRRGRGVDHVSRLLEAQIRREMSQFRSASGISFGYLAGTADRRISKAV